MFSPIFPNTIYHCFTYMKITRVSLIYSLLVSNVIIFQIWWNVTRVSVAGVRHWSHIAQQFVANRHHIPGLLSRTGQVRINPTTLSLLFLSLVLRVILWVFLYLIQAHTNTSCWTAGRYYLEQFIECIPLETEKKAEKVLRICEQRELIDSSNICQYL